MLIIDAGNLPRFMQCNGNVLLQADPAFTERDNTIREEGNAAHWLASMVFEGANASDLIGNKANNGVFITREMAEHVSDYSRNLPFSTDGETHVEWSYQINGPNWQIRGRADKMLFSQAFNSLHVDDLKYGYSIVEPFKNWTLISHAIGFCVTKGVRPKRIVFTIHQPRAPHHAGRVREWSIGYDELLALYHELAATLSNPSNMLNTGSQCHKCPAFIGCVARQNAELNAVEISHIAYSAEISDDDLADRLDEISRAMALLKQSEKAYNEVAMHRVERGKIVRGYMLQNDLANSTWKDWMTPELFAALTNRDICERKLPSLKAAREAEIPETLITAWTERRPKGKKLVRVNADDKGKKLFGNK